MNPRPTAPRRAPGAGPTLVALLRGVNVGGKNRLAMRDLAGVFEALGCADVRTHLQSGNVVFRAPGDAAEHLAAEVTARLAARFELAVPVVLRTGDEIAEVARNNPFLAGGAGDVDALHVAFLADAPDARAVASLDPDRSPPDAFVVVGREVYLRCPNGLGRTRLTNAYFDARLGTVSTVRNWRTVLALAALAAGQPGPVDPP